MRIRKFRMVNSDIATHDCGFITNPPVCLRLWHIFFKICIMQIVVIYNG